MKIEVTRSSLPEFQEYIDEIKDIWNSRWLTNMGEKHKKLEILLQDYLAVPNISLFTNGHLALENIIDAFDLKGNVITTPFTFASTTHAIVRCGLKPVFCDIKSDDYTINEKLIENHIDHETSAIIPVHVYGNICNTTAIQEIATKHNLKLIYDAAHAFGVTWQNQGIGNFGDASMFSFHATKVFNTIEGGAVTFKDEWITKRLYELKNFGISGPESVDFVGGNAKMNEFQAAMGICNIKRVNSDIKRRKQIHERYLSNLSSVSGIKLLVPQTDAKANYSYFPVLLDQYKYSRDQLFLKLADHDIRVRKYFYPLTSNYNCYSNKLNHSETPVAEFVADNILTLPMYPDLSLEDVDRICGYILG